jgi:hypothetical protein
MKEKSERGDRAERNRALLGDLWSTVDNESDAAAIRLIGVDAAAVAPATVTNPQLRTLREPAGSGVDLA